jgi:hypothetical protein
MTDRLSDGGVPYGQREEAEAGSKEGEESAKKEYAIRLVDPSASCHSNSNSSI